MKWGEKWLKNFDLSSLRLLGIGILNMWDMKSAQLSIPGGKPKRGAWKLKED
jgi:hypothetical protein